MTPDEITSFIEQVELTSPTEDSWLLEDEALPPLVEQVRQGAVVDSNVVTFPDGTPLRVKNMVGSWLLFAQRAASAKVVDASDTTAWVTAYQDTLLRTGWIQQGDTQAWTAEEVQGSSVHEQILAVVSVVLGPAPAALAIVTAALKSLQGMNADSPWITLFDRRGKSATAVGFQVAHCDPGAEGGAALNAIDFRVHAEQVMTQVLFFTFTTRKASMFRRGTVLVLTPAAMEAYGPQVQQRVEAAVLDSIAAIELADPA